ncbi:stress response protein nst1 [Trichonephila clavipes]|nr:stress response protein nst1 [Trichonephila clavipes]
MEIAERKRLDEAEERKRRDEMDFELHKKRIELKEGNEAESVPDIIRTSSKNSELTKNMLGDTSYQYSTFGNCEPEKDAADYEFVKKLLLQRFKLSPEKFRQLSVKHQKNPDVTWKDFYYEIRNFCEEWLNGLDIQTFEDLKDLLITDQMKKKVPSEVREHFLDEWAKIKTPRVLVEKLDEYEDVHGKTKRPAGPFFNKEKSYR